MPEVLEALLRLPVAGLGSPISPKEPYQGTRASTSNPLTGTAGTSYEVPGRVAQHTGRLGIWAVVGSAHRLSGTHKPHNSAYVIDDGGNVVDRYDKRFCSGDVDEETGDLAHYSPGDGFSVWDMDEVRCAALICYNYRFPELSPPVQEARGRACLPFVPRRPHEPTKVGRD